MLTAEIAKEMYKEDFFFPEKMKIKATEHLLVDNGNTKVMNRKESLLANDFILNCKEVAKINKQM